MTIFEAFKKASEETSSRTVAKELLKFVLNTDESNLILKFNEKLKDEKEYFKLIERFKNSEPLEYIVEKASFLDREFFVKKGVLIPRFETEILVEKTLEIAKNIKNPKICEIGFGSGIISISLEKELPNSKIIASDISTKALEVAKVNASKFNSKVSFIKCAYMDKIDGNFDIIVSNPPYIKEDYKLDKWVKNEPDMALFGGKDGHEILENIIILAKKRAKYLACEIGYDQKEILSNILDKNGFVYEFYKDLAGFDRGFVAMNKRENFE
ncbi:protein-(glutamine-N5) methyltransferase [Campylobacter blaseri]|uniref:peptide chain release factor N(5)-glutamine methyltransferase n=1 Tax=Campylobacter blaseri TaxID=2042961 RepID=A0A2P8QZR0_9BACT|nr:peptide chain release factor N(5)-glutamine methyltransferase [Campylobacter blaseri]PSM51736.1 protein-(glutamine-N5) methyltransferase, release factor-specific [Campylobacter blaseri]PSM53527.1 protein-(glutamine-N5) methyltransferase, release factor-specific [Campylobacter blaseri]QKF86337.1 protein-(glutamine-N5) methyltransferase [Campylobacter blaseri]